MESCRDRETWYQGFPSDLSNNTNVWPIMPSHNFIYSMWQMIMKKDRSWMNSFSRWFSIWNFKAAYFEHVSSNKLGLNTETNRTIRQSQGREAIENISIRGYHMSVIRFWEYFICVWHNIGTWILKWCSNPDKNQYLCLDGACLHGCSLGNNENCIPHPCTTYISEVSHTD